MGITIHYRGTVNDIGEIPLLEDRLLDFAFAMGGRATLHRFYSDANPARVVKGLVIELAEGQESLSLLISPEGHLTPIFQIEEAELQPFSEPPYCSVKTQFGSPRGHVAIVHLLHALRERFVSNLTVLDEGDYYETRDLQQLIRKMNFLKSCIDRLAGDLTRYPISPEALEDPDILATRIERVAQLANRSIVEGELRQTELLQNEEEAEAPDAAAPTLDDEVDAFDRLRSENEQRIERMNRRIEDSIAAGLSFHEAFEQALREQGLQIPQGRPEDSWQESLTFHSFDDSGESAGEEPDERRETRHPAVAKAMDFIAETRSLRGHSQPLSAWYLMLEKATFDILGGLAQATVEDTAESADADRQSQRALAISQLKRAMRGNADAFAAIHGLSITEMLEKEQAKELYGRLNALLDDIQALASTAWRGTAEP